MSFRLGKIQMQKLCTINMKGGVTMKVKELLGLLFSRKIIGFDEETEKKVILIRIRMILELSFLMFVFFLLIIFSLKKNDILSVLYRLSVTLFLISILFIFWYLELICLKECVENAYIRKSYAELSDFMRVVRSQRHDFNLHMQTIANMIRSGDYEGCDAYLKTILKQVTRTNEAMLVSDTAVSALLSSYYETAQSKNINMMFDICHTMEGAVLKNFHLNTILGNLLQNAIDEVEAHEDDQDRWIVLYVLKRGRKLIFKVSNPFYGDLSSLDRFFELGYSTKDFHEGVGLANVKRILSLNSGLISMEYRDEVLSVIAQIPLKLI